MTKFLIGLLLICITSKNTKAQNNFEISIPETYELSNIILALTDYGKTDEWEVQKHTAYYKEVTSYFEPMKEHPLLKTVNYSRQLWEDYLSFRTDAVACQFENTGQLARTNTFYTNKGHKPFDENLALIDDFVQRSNFRSFYKAHINLYNAIIANYANYYMLDTMRTFLETESGITAATSNTKKYRIVLSPLVGRMNCHRNMDSVTTADFPTLSIALIKNNAAEMSNQAERAVEIHTLFTEMDHGYVNPVTDRFNKEVEKNFDNKYWDNKSGYDGLNCFNEYMTWALYDLFVQKYFPLFADSVSIQWHYQNASRGFYASNLFANQLKALHQMKKPNEKLKDLYPKLLSWTVKNQSENRLPVLVLPKKDSIYVLPKNKDVVLNFSTRLKRKFNKISCIVMKLDNGRATKERDTITLTQENVKKWVSDTSVVLKLSVPHPEFALIFNWWGCRYPVLSSHDIMLSPQSYVLFKKE